MSHPKKQLALAGSADPGDDLPAAGQRSAQRGVAARFERQALAGLDAAVAGGFTY